MRGSSHCCYWLWHGGPLAAARLSCIRWVAKEKSLDQEEREIERVLAPPSKTARRTPEKVGMVAVCT